MSYRIRKVGASEVEAVHEILRKCGQDMKVRLGLGHWDPPYPLDLMRRDAEKGGVYTVRHGDRAVGTFTIGTEPFSYYDMTIWEAPGARAMYVSRLAVLPELQGNGIGRWCMGTVEQLARDDGCAAVRLDVYGKHKKLLEFYTRLGYLRRGVVDFREAELVCFERVIRK
jgi:GNAT superfamily N-acetyltransferase